MARQSGPARRRRADLGEDRLLTLRVVALIGARQLARVERQWWVPVPVALTRANA